MTSRAQLLPSLASGLCWMCWVCAGFADASRLSQRFLLTHAKRLSRQTSVTPSGYTERGVYHEVVCQQYVNTCSGRGPYQGKPSYSGPAFTVGNKSSRQMLKLSRVLAAT